MSTAPHAPNHLIQEKSPYLLQHAHNPVDWYPWGEEAFAKAKAEDKPVFLSIGYSTCHWCHVMERESFEDEEVAALLNAHFVAIKVDREERPDVDAVYMNVCIGMTGHGGWPLTVLLTPERKPFYAGTYFPKHARYNIPGMMELLENVKQQWGQKREKLISSSEEITATLLQRQEKGAGSRDAEPSQELLLRAASQLAGNFDKARGGFGDAPKFPAAHNLMFLMRHAYYEGDAISLAMVERTLEQMYRGGIYDHIGFGFSRYSTDAQWLVPHFEKMLYDNALLALSYLDAHQFTHKALYRHVATQILTYVMREMTHEEGGFYCAQDADSDGVEGKYYVFTPQEVVQVLGEEDAKFICDCFGITDEGNFEGASIPNLLHNEMYDVENPRIMRLLGKLRDFRAQRTTLHKDDKILTAWNALMICAFARAYSITQKQAYLDTARKAMDFIERRLTDSNGGLYVRWRDGEAAGQGHLDDYAFTVWALLCLYDASFDAAYLTKAKQLALRMLDEFFDENGGGLYLYGKTAEQLITRPKELYDGAMPSGNSVAAYVLLRLEKMTGEPAFAEAAHRQLAFLAGQATVRDYPAGHCFAMLSMAQAVYPSRELICVLVSPSEMQTLQDVLMRSFLPDTNVLVKTANSPADFLPDYPVGEKSAYYLCQGGACSAPMYSIAELQAKLDM